MSQQLPQSLPNDAAPEIVPVTRLPLHSTQPKPTAPAHFMHRMPFGPTPVNEYLPDLGYEFRLWAPAKERIELVHIPSSGERLLFPCVAHDGWHSCRLAQARSGDRYAFRVADGLEVPDPASRFNPDDVHGPSQLTSPTSFDWDPDWIGRPWEEAVIYEMHVGTFTPEGRYDSAEARLGELAQLGITAIELMPLADFSGTRGWGYDGVLPFAPDASYGTPDELKHFIQAAHRHGLMVFLDVVYNHFGPEGNYLHAYAPQFFTSAHHTPWGNAVNFDGEGSETVREFFVHNALYWLQELRFDGLRFDAVHAILDDSRPHILEEIAHRARETVRDRHIHLILENGHNEASRLGKPGEPGRYEAQWNDDFHHAAHVALTGETDGYYTDFSERPVAQLLRCLTEGFAFQGDVSPYHGGARGERTYHLPASAFVNFLQNHDQIGNRAFGERLTALAPAHALRALVAVQLLAPSPPLIFMGEEVGATTPFLYFCDFHDELAQAVRDGRRREFGDFAHFTAGGKSREIPDPGAESTFRESVLDWGARGEPQGQQWLAFYRGLLELRRTFIVPQARWLLRGRGKMLAGSERAFEAVWPTADGFALVMQANLGDNVSPSFTPFAVTPFATVGEAEVEGNHLGPWSVRTYVLPAKLLIDGGRDE